MPNPFLSRRPSSKWQTWSEVYSGAPNVEFIPRSSYTRNPSDIPTNKRVAETLFDQDEYVGNNLPWHILPLDGLTERALFTSLQADLRDLGDELFDVGHLPETDPKPHWSSGENDTAGGLMAYLKGSTRVLATQLARVHNERYFASVHFDSEAQHLTDRELPDGAQRCRPDLTVTLQEDLRRQAGDPWIFARDVCPLSVVELKSLSALPGVVIASMHEFHDRGSAWSVYLNKRTGELSVQDGQAAQRYGLRASTADQHRPPLVSYTVVVNLLDLAGYVHHLGGEWGLLSNGNEHLLILVDYALRRIHVSRPMGRTGQSPDSLDRPKSLLWLQAAVAADRILKGERERHRHIDPVEDIVL